MASWTGITLARTAPGGDGMQSRLSTYLHPLAGRPLLWHTLSALAHAVPPADRLVVVGGAELNPELFAELGARLGIVPVGQSIELSGDPDHRVLVVDGAAPALGAGIATLLAEPTDAALPGPDGHIAAAWLSPAGARRVLEDEAGLDGVPTLGDVRLLPPAAEALLVRDRASLAGATRLIHDTTVTRLMSGGVTFLLPDTVLVDVDVQIGRDTVVYPGVALEGHTSVGEETVVGPGCRIIDSWIGSGVELKGWNFISRASVRNRAILEPYVRRGFD